MDYVGARVHIIDAHKHKASIGLRGIVTAVSKNCYYIAVDYENGSGSGDGCSGGGVNSRVGAANCENEVVSVPTAVVADATPAASEVVKTKKSQQQLQQPLQQPLCQQQNPPKKRSTAVAITYTIPTAAENKALLVIKDETILGIVLPNPPTKQYKQQREREQQDQQSLNQNQQQQKKKLFGPSSGNDDNPNDDENEQEVEEKQPTPTAASDETNTSSYKYDHNERNDSSGKMCLLYGKHFMPFCKFD